MPHVPPAGPADVTVRPRPDAPPVAAGPVEHVVRAPGRAAGRPVGDLVPAEARRAEHLVGDQVAIGENVVVRRGQLAAPDPRGQPRARLHGQRVRGHVVGPGGDGGLQRAPPVGVGLAGRPVDQVQADVLESGGPGPRRTTGRAPRLVHAIKDREHAGHRALHPERHAGHARRAQFAQGGFVDAFRVGLRRHLGSGCQAELGVNGSQDVAEGGRGHQGGRPAAEEHRAHRDVRARFASGQHLPGEPDLGQGQGGIAAQRDDGRAGPAAEFGGGVGVEVAVAAAGRAERHVHVNPERLLAQPAVRAVRQEPVGGDGFTVGQGTRHASHATCPGGPRGSGGRGVCPLGVMGVPD